MPPEIYYQEISQYSLENKCVEVGLQLYLKTPTQMFSCKYWEIFKKPILKNICVRLLLKILQEEIDQDFLSGESLSKTSRRSNITKIPFAFKPEPFLNLTPTLYFELRFPIFIINGYDRKVNACSPRTSCYYGILYAIRYQFKNEKDVYLGNLYDTLSNLNKNLRLDLGIQNFENQCHSVNELLNKNGQFLRVQELKDKFRYLIKRNSEKKTVLRELSSCIIEKFNGFNIVRVKFSKKTKATISPYRYNLQTCQKM